MNLVKYGAQYAGQHTEDPWKWFASGDAIVVPCRMVCQLENNQCDNDEDTPSNDNDGSEEVIGR